MVHCNMHYTAVRAADRLCVRTRSTCPVVGSSSLCVHRAAASVATTEKSSMKWCLGYGTYTRCVEAEPSSQQCPWINLSFDPTTSPLALYVLDREGNLITTIDGKCTQKGARDLKTARSRGRGSTCR